ncbi:MAG: N-6 DNA methylase, partial [Proteobacteria bacterium]|nr:N-6 DNA methylase [Pseudomonadota bacterium]
EKEILKHYALGHKWQNLGDDWQQGNKTQTRPPQVLFIERCLEMLKPGGKLGIVLPDGLLGNTGDAYIRKFILDKAIVLAVVDCPTETFAPHTPTKTSVLILQKLPAQAPSNIFFAIANECGHNKRGTPTGKSDFAKIATTYNQHLTSGSVPQDWFGFYADRELDKRRILVPRYYDPLIIKEIASFDDKQWDMVSMNDLIVQSAIEISGISGCPTSLEYDARGEIRFIRTSDVSGFEVGEHAQIKIPLDVWQANKASQDLKIGDILFVKDGDDKIGNCAILVDGTDLKISVQSHFHKIRSLTIDPYLLLWALNTPIVEKQIRQRVFSQSTLKTIGIRITELVLPLPKDEKDRKRIAAETKQCVVSRRDAWLKMRATMPK